MLRKLQLLFGPEYHWFTAARLNNIAKFDVLCQNCKYPNRAANEVLSMYRSSPQCCTADETQVSCFWEMFRAVPCQALQEIYQRLLASTDAQLGFKGLHYHIRDQLDAHLGRLIVNGFNQPESCSMRMHVAQTFLQCGAKLYDFCLQQKSLYSK